MRPLLTLAALLGLAAIAWAPGAGAAEYLETFETERDPAKIMAGNLLIGDDGVWSGALDGGVYVLSNAGKEGVARFYTIGFKGQAAETEPAELTVAVEIDGSFASEIAGAGLIYAHDVESNSYFAFIVNREGGYTVLRRGAKGLRKVASGKNDAIRPSGVNRLFVQIEADKARLFVNEDQIIAHSAKQAALGRAGIYALDRGSFRFDNFRLAAE